MKVFSSITPRFLTVAVLLLAFTAAFHSNAAEKAVGVSTGYVSKNKSVSADLFMQYGITKKVRIAPRIGCIFRHHDLDALSIDLDVQMPFSFTGERVRLYPLAGLNYSMWNRHDINSIEDPEGIMRTADPLDVTDDVSTRTSRFGLNLGAGVEMFVTKSLKLNAEMKYNFIKHYSATKINIGIAYVF